MEGGSHHDAHAMGQHLHAHLASLHGGAYAKAFADGMCGGSISRTGQYEGEGTKKGMSRKTARKAYEGEPHEFHEVEGGYGLIDKMEALQKDAEKKTKAQGMPYKGGSATPSMGLSQVRGGAKKPMMEGDGRKKRAEIVKRVMREKGCSMIEASKFVKAHGLY
jgi:hypothetical protein